MIHADSQPAPFQTRFTNGAQSAVADATPDKGGGNAGFRPHELLEAAFATCMNMSLRMYADKHALPLEGIGVTVALDRGDPAGSAFAYRIELHGPLSEAQKDELLAAAENCPVRKTLSGSLGFRRQPVGEAHHS